MPTVKLNVFGRRVLVERNADWVAYYLRSEGKRRLVEDIVIPRTITEGELERNIADLCHEWATPRNPNVVRIP
jgi:hypothetical protein